jgi:hypothetical protein
LSADGDLLLFEANATMVIAAPDADERWAYRRTAIVRVIDAVVAMIREKAAAAGRAAIQAPNHPATRAAG